MNAKPTTTKPVLFDTSSTGELSGSSTTNSTHPSPTVRAVDKATQTGEEPFTFKREDSDVTTAATEYICQELETNAPSPSVASEGPQSNGGGRNSTCNDETKQTTDDKILCEQNKGLVDRTEPSSSDSRNGCNSCLPGPRRSGDDCRDLINEFKRPTDAYKLAFCVDCKCWVQLKKDASSSSSSF